jgi:predicted xylose isomerase-like sugar epimerase
VSVQTCHHLLIESLAWYSELTGLVAISVCTNFEAFIDSQYSELCGLVLSTQQG